MAFSIWPFSKRKNDAAVVGGGGYVRNRKDGKLDFFGYGASAPPTTSMLFAGETTPLLFGDTRIYELDYYTLRERSWQLYAETEIVPIIVNRLTAFVIGSGLKLQAEPAVNVLSKYNVKMNRTKWSNDVEALFGLYAGSTIPDWSAESNLHQLAKTAYTHSKVAGDILIVLRISEDKYPQVQLIDGANVVSPPLGSDVTKDIPEGNKIIDGVELNAKNQHVAYWVMSKAMQAGDVSRNFGENKIIRILANSTKTGRRQAWLMYGSKYRLGKTRGMPLFTCIMQKIKQLSRYSEAEVLAAEENAKFIATIKHKEFSTGENPLRKTSIGRRNASIAAPELSASSQTGDVIAGMLSKSTGGTVANLGLGQELQSYDTKRPNVNFEKFFDGNMKAICAACDIPVEVAYMLFSNNYSASRAALKMFEHVLNTERNLVLTPRFYKPIYSAYVTTTSLSNFIFTPGFSKGFLSKDPLFAEAYFKSRFIGAPIPNVDELKEVKASAEKLKNKLTTYEKETEKLGNGDYSENIVRLKAEVAAASGLVIDDENNEVLTSQTEGQDNG